MAATPEPDGTVPFPAGKARGLPPIGRPHVTRVDGTELFWTDLGDGEPIVLLHGIADSHRTWRYLAPLLATRYRVLMPDLPGCGLSGRPDAPYSLDWYSGVVDHWMQAVGVPRAHLCGHSYGGGVAQWMVMTCRTRVNRLALVAAGGLGTDVALGLRLAAIEVAERLFTSSAMWLGSRLVLALAPRTFGDPSPEEAAEAARVNALPGTGLAFARTVRGVIDFRGQYVQTCREAAIVRDLPPIALFWGDDDRILPSSHGRMAVERFQGASLSIFQGCGHFPQLQDPGRLAHELTDFLADTEREAARILFACPEGPRAEQPDALPVGRCANCTFLSRRARPAAVPDLSADVRAFVDARQTPRAQPNVRRLLRGRSL